MSWSSRIDVSHVPYFLRAGDMTASVKYATWMFRYALVTNAWDHCWHVTMAAICWYHFHIDFILRLLEHWGLDKMATIFQTTFSNAFSWRKGMHFDNMSLKLVPYGQINNIPALVMIMAWCRPGDKPWSEPMLEYSKFDACMRHSASVS